MRQIEIEWVELNKKVTANLIPDNNPELCDLLWERLPYTSIQTHALVSGHHLYHIAPIVELVTTKAQFKVPDRTKSDDGTIFLSQLQHMAIKYGKLSEYLPAAPVGQVIPEHIPILKEAGEGCWDAVYRTKQVVEVRVSRKGDDSKKFYFPTFEEIKREPVRSLLKEIQDETWRTWVKPPQEVLDIHAGAIRSGAGSCGQYFTTMLFVNGEARPLGYSGFGGLMQLCKNPEITLDTLQKVAPHFVKTPAEFLGYCGLDTLWSFTERTLKLLPDLKNKDELFALVSMLALYTNQLNAWNLHFFPWAEGRAYTFATQSESLKKEVFLDVAAKQARDAKPISFTDME
ncbi:MAG TPA: hypothetical protein VFW62_04035 [bacterium]|nr:hypothetical protein [bacterium]